MKLDLLTTDLVQTYADEYHEYHGISARRRVRQVQQLRHLDAFLVERGNRLVDIDADAFGDYLRRLMHDGLSPATVRNRMGLIRPFVKWLWLQNVIPAETYLRLAEVQPPRVAASLPRPYKPAEIQSFWGELHEHYPWVATVDDDHPHRQDPERHAYFVERWKRDASPYSRVMPGFKRIQIEAIVALALYGGLRRVEIFNLDLDHIHPENEYLLVNSAKKGPAAHAPMRAVPWMGNCRTAVGAWLEVRELVDPDHDAPWLSLHNGHREKAMRFRQFEVLLSSLGSGWEFHRLRHTFATQALRSGMPLEVLSKVLGHTRLQQTLGYAELMRGDMVVAAARVNGNFTNALAPKEAA